ncbi:MAG TPA: S53 family peptidase [Ktedonobacteraceae bacterium]|nr:S53 family peptidase [Ktedonobacteraceae bacterium]
MFQYRNAHLRMVAALIGIVLLFTPLAGCNTSNPIQFVPINLGIPAQALNSPVIGNLPDSTKLHVGITFKISQNLLNKLSSQKIQPGKPSHLEQIANQLGISDATYQKIKGFFNLQGIALNLSKLRTHLTVTASAKTFGKIFQTHFVIHKYNGRAFYAPAAAPEVPQFLANTIVAVTGLDNYSQPPIHDFTLSGINLDEHLTPKQPGQDCYALGSTLLPKQIAHAYGYDQLWNRGLHGENMTVNLVEIDGFYQQDVQNYLDCINFQGKVNVVDVDGSPTQALGESTLDLDMVAGLARSVNIVDYETDGNAPGDTWVQVNDELQQIINDNTNNANSGSVVSISLGIDERDITSQDIAAMDQSFQLLTRAEHMTVFIASGDCAAFADGTYRSLSVSFPASDPWVTSVGGTILSTNVNWNRTNEVVWSDGSNPFACKNQWGSGGGNSILYSRPGWQNAAGVNNQYSRSRRQIPDISAAAYNLAVYFQGQWGAVGGTSAAAPIWATGMALVNQGLMNQVHQFAYSPQLFYTVADNASGSSPYYDVTRGNNLYYPATPGWDFASGLGTPNLADFYNILARLL